MSLTKRGNVWIVTVTGGSDSEPVDPGDPGDGRM